MSTVVIDATHFGTAAPTGVERYTDVVLPMVSEELLQRRVAVRWIGHLERPPAGMPDGVVWVYSPHRPWWSQRVLRRALKAIKPDLFFTPSGLPPLNSPCPTALTIHDLGMYHAPRAYSLGQRLRLGWMSKWSAHRAEAVIVPSRSVAADCRDIWNISEKKIRVIPHGYRPGSSHPKREAEVPTILFVGRVEKKKNLGTVMKAWEAVRKKKPVRLIIAGGPGYGWNALCRRGRSLAEIYPDDIVFTGRISEEARQKYMSMAWVLAVPCPYEGFGFPVLEAFDAGTPAVCARAGSLPEVGGKAVLYAEPFNAKQWARRIDELITQPDLRQELRRAGKERLRHYSWETTAHETALALLRVIGR